MRLRLLPAALCAISLLAGCGGDGGDAQATVKQWLPKAEQIHCTSPRQDVTSCEVSVRKVPVGTEHWHCSFEATRGEAAHSGSHSCWTEDGSPESLSKDVRAD